MEHDNRSVTTQFADLAMKYGKRPAGNLVELLFSSYLYEDEKPKAAMPLVTMLKRTVA